MRSPVRMSMLLTASLMSTLTLAAPQESRVPGGIAILPLPATLSADISASYNGHPLLVETAADGARRLIVGIPLAATPGEAVVQITAGKKMKHWPSPSAKRNTPNSTSPCHPMTNI